MAATASLLSSPSTPSSFKPEGPTCSERAIATATERGGIDLLVAMTTTRLAAQEKEG